MIFTTRSFAQCFSYVRSSRRGTRKGACRERARLLACVCTTKEFPASTEASHPLFSFVFYCFNAISSLCAKSLTTHSAHCQCRRLGLSRR